MSRVNIQFDNVPETLCKSCKASTIVQSTDGTTKIFCSSISCPEGGGDYFVPHEVRHCSAYFRKGQLTRAEAEAYGWVLEVNKARRVGFSDETIYKWKNPAKVVGDDPY